MSFQHFIRALARHKAALFEALEGEDTTALRVLRHEEKEIHERLYENLGCRYVVSRVDLVGLVWHPLIHADPRDTHWAASTWFRPVFVSKTPR